jgi:hypothetical protein
VGADRRDREHRPDDPPPPRAEVAGRVEDVAQDVAGPGQLRAAAADADVVPAREDDVDPRERDRREGDGRERRNRPAQRHRSGQQDEEALRREHERTVGVGRDRREDREPPERPGAAAAAIARAQEREVRERARQQEEAVHPGVDAVEEERPARADERGRHRGRDPARKPGDQRRDDGDGGDGEEGGAGPQRRQAAAGVDDDPREQEVERRAATVDDRVDQVGGRAAAGEQLERLVLVRPPCRHRIREEERDGECRHGRDGDERVDPNRPDACLRPGWKPHGTGLWTGRLGQVAPAADASLRRPCRSTSTSARIRICSRFSTA